MVNIKKSVLCGMLYMGSMHTAWAADMIAGDEHAAVREHEDRYDDALKSMKWGRIELARANIKRFFDAHEKPFSLGALNNTWLDAESDQPSSFLSQVVYTSSPALLELLLKRYPWGIDLDGRQGCVARKTALMFALDKSQQTIIELLLRKGAKLDAVYVHIDNAGTVHELTAFTYSDFFNLPLQIKKIRGKVVVCKRDLAEAIV
jgi:hypothetical protein